MWQLLNHQDTAKMIAFLVYSTEPLWRLRRHCEDDVENSAWHRLRTSEEWADHFFRTAKPYHAFLTIFGDHRLFSRRYSLKMSRRSPYLVSRYRTLLYPTDRIVCGFHQSMVDGISKSLVAELYLLSDYANFLCRACENMLISTAFDLIVSTSDFDLSQVLTHGWPRYLSCAKGM